MFIILIADNYILNSIKVINKDLEVNKYNYDNELYNRFQLELSKYIINNKDDKKQLKNIVNSRNNKEQLNEMVSLLNKITKTLISKKEF